jgi:uncharacterized protein YggU (UPF0235/DUF167 family)
MAMVAVRVRPSSARRRIGPYAEGVLTVDVTRPPADGEATEAARLLVAEALGIAPSRVRLVAGARSRLKRFEVAALTDAAVASRLRQYRWPAG